MNFDELLINPQLIVIAVIVTLMVAGWTVMHLRWAILGEEDAITAGLCIAVGLFLLFAAIRPPNLYIGYATLGITLATAVLFPILMRLITQRQMLQIEIEQVEGIYSQLYQRPQNWSARFRLAEKLYHRGMIAQAVAIGDKCLSTMPSDSFQNEHRSVSTWRSYLTQDPREVELVCPKCGTMNQAHEVLCTQCGYGFLEAHFRSRIVLPASGRRIILGWLGAVTVALGLPWLAALSLPNSLRIGLIAIATVAACVLLLGAVFPVKRR